jgi:hypothetical protein
MLHAYLESLDAFVLVLTIVGVCCRISWRMVCVMMVGMSGSRMLVVHLACLLARRSRPYVAVLKVSRAVVKEYGQVLS